MAKKTLEMVSNPPPSLLITDGAQVSQEEDEIKGTEASLNAAIPVSETLEMVSTGADQVRQGEDEIKEIEAFLTAYAAIPVQEEAQSSMEPQYIILDVNQEKNQYKRLKRNLQIKKYLHFCCNTCVKDGSRVPLCTVLEDQNDACLCQHMKLIKNEEGAEENNNLLYTERLHAIPRRTEFVMYDEISFQGEVMCCRVCFTKLGYRYLPRDPEVGQIVRNSAGQMEIRHEGPYIPYFIIERSQLKIIKVTFNTAAADDAAAATPMANEAANEAAVANEATGAAANEEVG